MSPQQIRLGKFCPFVSNSSGNVVKGLNNNLPPLTGKAEQLQQHAVVYKSWWRTDHH